MLFQKLSKIVSPSLSSELKTFWAGKMKKKKAGGSGAEEHMVTSLYPLNCLLRYVIEDPEVLYGCAEYYGRDACSTRDAVVHLCFITI